MIPTFHSHVNSNKTFRTGSFFSGLVCNQEWGKPKKRKEKKRKEKKRKIHVILVRHHVSALPYAYTLSELRHNSTGTNVHTYDMIQVDRLLDC